jgi:pyruvate dehydrogenase E2 component (dihydrolipoamide acetyltransferase)
MADFIVMPKLGLTMTEGTIRDWQVKEGDVISIGDLIFEIETDKITKSFESPQEGTLIKILIPDGIAKVREPVAIIGQAGEDVSDMLPISTDSRTEDTAPTIAPEIVTPTQAKGGKVKISPKAKRLAETLGVDYTAIAGSGPGGSISAEDIEQAAAQPKATPMAAIRADQLGVDLKEVKADERIRKGDVERHVASSEVFTKEPMSRMRQIISARMKESQEISAPVNFTVSVDMTEIRKLRKDLESKKKISYNDLIVMILSRTLRDFPLLNASVEGNEIVYHQAVHMGIAVALEEGLMVPVLRDADTKTLSQISDETAELAASCRDMSINPDLLEGSTFSITNLGMYGIESFTPIINQPNVAILGVNAIEEKHIIRADEVLIRPMMKLSLTADHRIVDGAVAAQFLKKLKERLEQPALLFL